MNNTPHDHASDGEFDEFDEFDARSDDFVRRLLADAHGESPMPEHVAARLDDTLAELVAERGAELTDERGAQPTEPTELTDVRARRRRRVLVGLGAAAAFVVAAGVALPTLVGTDHSVRSTTTSDEVAAEQRVAGPLVLAAESAERSVQDYVAALDEPVETPPPVPLSRPRGGAEAPPTCAEPGDGEVHPATYDGRPALLVLAGVDGDRVLARVVVCDADSVSDGENNDRDNGDWDTSDRYNRDSQGARANEVPVQFVVPQP